MHDDGEIDTRATYTGMIPLISVILMVTIVTNQHFMLLVISIARILNIMTPELVSGTLEYILSCQTYEGGFGGEPSNEAHGNLPLALS